MHRRAIAKTATSLLHFFVSFLHLIWFMTGVLNMFLVLTGVSHQCHLLWQHLSHHLQKIQQILWPPGNYPSLKNRPSYAVQVGILLKSCSCFPLMHSESVNRHDCLYRLICEPCDFSLQLPLYSTPWHLYESVCGLVIDRGAGETWLVSVSPMELRQYATSLRLRVISISLLFCLSDLTFFSRISSHLCLTSQNVRVSTCLFMVQAGKTKREINLMDSVFKHNPTWRRWTFFPLVGVGFMNTAVGGGALKALHCTSMNNSILFQSLCAHMPLGHSACCKLIPYVYWTKGSPVNMLGLQWETYRGQK